jgi:hypothetical protein
MRSRAIGAALLLLAARSAVAGPWPVGKGRIYAKLSYEFLRSTELAQPDGTRFDIPEFVKQGSGLYLAWGASGRLTLIGEVPAWRSSDLDAFERADGFGDLRLGAQYLLGRRGRWLVAVRGLLQAPTGDETRGGGLLPTGSGVWEAEGLLSAGRSFGGGSGYGFVEVGHQHRSGGLTDGLFYGAQLGWNATRRLTLAANLRGVEPYSHAPKDTPIGSPVGVSDRVTYAYYGPTAIVKLGAGVSLQLDAERVFNAKNLATGVTWRAGLAYSR